MAAEATSKTKHSELKALEKQLQLSILKEKAPQTDSCLAFEVVGLFFYIHTYLWLCTIKFIEVEQFFFRGINHSSRQKKMAK